MGLECYNSGHLPPHSQLMQRYLVVLPSCLLGCSGPDSTKYQLSMVTGAVDVVVPSGSLLPCIERSGCLLDSRELRCIHGSRPHIAGQTRTKGELQTRWCSPMSVFE